MLDEIFDLMMSAEIPSDTVFFTLTHRTPVSAATAVSRFQQWAVDNAEAALGRWRGRRHGLPYLVSHEPNVLPWQWKDEPSATRQGFHHHGLLLSVGGVTPAQAKTRWRGGGRRPRRHGDAKVEFFDPRRRVSCLRYILKHIEHGAEVDLSPGLLKLLPPRN